MYELEIDVPEVSYPHPVDQEPPDPDRIDDLSEAQLDELSFGVICLDRWGAVLRYNLAEARLARLDRAQVLGRNFFRQVAPCTARREFQGRFEAFLGATEGSSVVHRFTFLFDFKFGAQLVTVEFARSRHPDRAYILINRGQVLPARPEADAPAPSLSDLEGAPPPGVLRNARAERFVRLNLSAFQSLYSAAQRVGADGRRLFAEWGFGWGRVAVVDLEALALEERGVPLRSLRMAEALGLCDRVFSEQGWGSVQVDLQAAPRSGAFVAKVERSALLEALRCAPGDRHGFFEGYLRALFSHLASRRLAVRYIPEHTSEDPLSQASFLVLSEERLAHVEPLLSPPVAASTLLDHLARALP